MHPSKAAVLVATLCLVLAATPLFAQHNDCKPFRALLQARLDLSPTGHGWSGQVRALLGDEEPLFGTLTYLTVVSTGSGQAGKELDLRWKIDFGAHGVMVTETDRGVFPTRPKVPAPMAFGSYMATAQVAPDATHTTGRFQDATGHFSLIGLFVVDGMSLIASGWDFGNPDAWKDMGAWSAELNGKLCGVTAP